ncbi:MAG TPA: hypothetical protein VMP01_25565 [Pirellulaceae bacterium]|nr:hypothetical protein [Pirellulaceae bacterium]
MSCRITGVSVLALALAASVALAADSPAGLGEAGKPDLKSAGPLAFGPKGVLFVGDPQGAAVFAIGVGQAPDAPIGGEFKLEGVDAKVAALLGTGAGDILINDVAVEPGTKIAYLSVSRGRGPDAEPAIVRVDGKGTVTALALDKVPFAKVAISNAPESRAPQAGKKGGNPRLESITDLAFVDGRLFIAGLSNEEFASSLRSVEFPFKGKDTSTSVEIYHGAHGAFETRSPVRTFVPFNVGGEPQLLAAYTCTPLVRFPVSELKAGSKLRGTTVAELGNRNRPLDMIAYEKDGKQFLLLANSARGVMKISTDTLEKQEGITERVSGTAGLGYETLKELEGVEQLDKVGEGHAILLVRAGDKASLQTIALP